MEMDGSGDSWPSKAQPQRNAGSDGAGISNDDAGAAQRAMATSQEAPPKKKCIKS